MQNNAPTFTRGDMAYLRESAAIGNLEAVRISGVQLGPNDTWIYSYTTGTASIRTGRATFGDRRSFTNGQVIWVDASELITYCDALHLSIANLQAQLNSLLLLQRSNNCTG
jgi:hypothetical protein